MDPPPLKLRWAGPPRRQLHQDPLDTGHDTRDSRRRQRPAVGSGRLSGAASSVGGQNSRVVASQCRKETVFHRTRFVAAVLLLVFPACHSAPRYTVTATPITLFGQLLFCIAIDPTDPQGVWWWEPGRGCTSRSTGPDVFRAHRAVVTTTSSGGVEVYFQMQLMRGPRDVRLVLQDGALRDTSSGVTVKTEQRKDLKVPDLAGQYR